MEIELDVKRLNHHKGLKYRLTKRGIKVGILYLTEVFAGQIGKEITIRG